MKRMVTVFVLLFLIACKKEVKDKEVNKSNEIVEQELPIDKAALSVKEGSNLKPLDTFYSKGDEVLFLVPKEQYFKDVLSKVEGIYEVDSDFGFYSNEVEKELTSKFSFKWVKEDVLAIVSDKKDTIFINRLDESMFYSTLLNSSVRPHFLQKGVMVDVGLKELIGEFYEDNNIDVYSIYKGVSYRSFLGKDVYPIYTLENNKHYLVLSLTQKFNQSLRDEIYLNKSYSEFSKYYFNNYGAKLIDTLKVSVEEVFNKERNDIKYKQYYFSNEEITSLILNKFSNESLFVYEKKGGPVKVGLTGKVLFNIDECTENFVAIELDKNNFSDRPLIATKEKIKFNFSYFNRSEIADEYFNFLEKYKGQRDYFEKGKVSVIARKDNYYLVCQKDINYSGALFPNRQIIQRNSKDDFKVVYVSEIDLFGISCD